MYPVEIVQPMKEELTENGFKELLSKADVENQLKQTGTTLVMINSVWVVPPEQPVQVF